MLFTQLSKLLLKTPNVRHTVRYCEYLHNHTIVRLSKYLKYFEYSEYCYQGISKMFQDK